MQHCHKKNLQNPKKFVFLYLGFGSQVAFFMHIRYIHMDGKILRLQNFSILEKTLICLILGFQKSKFGKFFGSVEWVAEELGTKEENIWKALERLERKGIVEKNGDEWIISVDFINQIEKGG